MLRALLLTVFAFFVPSSAYALTIVGPTGPYDAHYAGDQLIWTEYTNNGAQVVTIDPATGAEVALFETRNTNSVLKVTSGGGRVHVEQRRLSESGDSFSTIVYDVTLNEDRPRRIASGRYIDTGGDCGQILTLLDTDQSGRPIIELFERTRSNSYEECIDPDGAGDRSTLIRYAADGTRDSLFSSTSKVRGSVFRKQYAGGAGDGDFLLAWSSTSARRLNLATGASRVIKPQSKGYDIITADVAQDGRVLLSEMKVARRAANSMRLTLIDADATRRRLGSVNLGFENGRFCGDRVVEERLTVTRKSFYTQLILHDLAAQMSSVLVKFAAPNNLSSIDCTASELSYVNSGRSNKGKLTRLVLPSAPT